MAEIFPTTTYGGGGGGAGTPNPVYVSPVQQPHAHEHTDIATRPLWVFMGFFIVVTILIHVGLYVLFFAYERSESEQDKDRTRSAVNQPSTGPPEPRLQGIPGFHVPTPREDQQRMRVEDRQRLTSYAPEQNGFAKIPIDRAIDLLVERGLPTQPQPTTQPTTQGGPDAR
jgi:hypothetical protein